MDTLKTVKIFLASSPELTADRFRILAETNRKNKEWHTRNIVIEIKTFEDILTNSKGDYEPDSIIKFMNESDIYMMLVSEIPDSTTIQEFDLVRRRFIKTGKPLIHAYFKYSLEGLLNSDEQIDSNVNSFKSEILELGHPLITYLNENQLGTLFNQQLDKLLADGHFSQPQQPAQPGQPAPATQYWLMKIRAPNWDIPSFRQGQDTWFSTHTIDSEKREEYSVMQQVKPGDMVLVYAYENYYGIVAIMRVLNGIHPDSGKGETITMSIQELFPNPISAAYLTELEFANELDSATPWRWRSITPTQYNSIIQKGGVKRQETIFPSYTTDDNHRQTEDKLAFTFDIDSFSTIMMLKEVKPPLAIGLFGNWGSGKSFFMEKLNEAIKKKSGSNSRYVDKVVQVTFNSWHYSDANLWASLITEIFDQLYLFSKKEEKEDELEKLSRTLQITTMQKEATEARKKELEQQQAELVATQQRKRDTLSDTSGLDLLRLILKDPAIQKDLKGFDNNNVEAIFQNKEKVQEYIEAVEDEKNKRKYFFSLLWNIKGRWFAVIIGAIILALAAIAVSYIPAVKEWWNNVTGWLAGIAVAISTIIAKVMDAWKPVKKQFDDAHIRLTSLKNTIDNRPVTETADVKKNRQELETIKLSLEKIDQQISATKKELEEIRSGRKLMEFIENRSRDEQYSRQLGLISWIRKDFKRLDELLRLQYNMSEEEKKDLVNPQNVQLQIDRIVLYIDDLDRCNEDTVVKVLEAVHLLLAFPLFVVVVGVDPRWLNKSLSKKYPFFNEYGYADPGNNLRDVSSFDYLEKIFQIPFSLKPITKEGREGLLAYLVEKEIQKEGIATISVTPTAINTTITNTGDTTNGQPPLPDTGTTPAQPGAGKDAVKEEVLQKQLTFSAQELTYMQEISALFGHTPRTIKRFVNIYRIIKAHGSFRPELDHRPTLLVLGIVVGCPHFAQLFVQELDKTKEYDFTSFLTKTTTLNDLSIWIKGRLNEACYAGMSIESARQNLSLIARFSFRTIGA